MFTGIVTDIGEVMEVTPRGEGLRRLTIGCDYDVTSIAMGASIACSGVCLTVVDKGWRPAVSGSRSMPQPKRFASRRLAIGSGHTRSISNARLKWATNLAVTSWRVMSMASYT